jgi:probable F420-dependent oxidoreductase
MHLTGTGVWSGNLRYGDAAESADAAAELDALGYSAIWIPDVGGDVFAPIENLLGATKGVAVATGILNIWMHDPAEVAQRYQSWREDQRRRVLLGLGVSHSALIDHNNPGRYAKPYSKMVEYLDGLDAHGFPGEARVLAALRQRMLELARDRTAGAHPYFVPAAHVARAREVLGPDKTIAVELAVVLDVDRTTARETARRHTAIYVTLPNYTNNLREFGFGDDDFTNAGSDRLIDAIVAWGDLGTIRERVNGMRDAGADHVCIQVIRADNEMPRAEWRELATALT